MGRLCAWCGTILNKTAASDQPVSHALCNGCLEDLRSALESSGMRIEESGLRPTAR